MNLTKALVLTTAALMTTAGAASAGVNTYVADGGVWNSAGSWHRTGGTDPDTYPDSDDIAIIDGATITVDGTSGASAAGDLQVSSSGQLIVNSSQTLTVGAASFASALVTHTINGNFILVDGKVEIDAGLVTVGSTGKFIMQGNTPELQVDVNDGFQLPSSGSTLEVKSNATISGTGKLLGGNSDAAVVINVDGAAAGITLTIAPGITLHGAFRVERFDTDQNAILDNQGFIRSDQGATIEIADNMSFVVDDGDGCTPTWRVDSGSVLLFSINAPSLVGAVQIDGTFDCGGNNVATTGRVFGSGSFDCLSAQSCP